MGKKVYIAGKYNDKNVVSVLKNIRAGVKVAVEVLKGGDIPFCPFLDCLFVLIGNTRGMNEQHFRDYSMRWPEACDEVWFLPSWKNSGGCKDELARAQELGITTKFIEGYDDRTNRFRFSDDTKD